jgi:hypothetical protein
MNEKSHSCLEHSKVEFFMQKTEKNISDQWQAINQMKTWALTSALSVIGTLVLLIVSIILKNTHLL